MPPTTPEDPTTPATPPPNPSPTERPSNIADLAEAARARAMRANAERPPLIIPDPDVLKRYDLLMPGTAARVLRLAEDELQHRRSLDNRSNQANLEAQRQTLTLQANHERACQRSELLGQCAGLALATCCVGGAIYLAMHAHEVVACALAALPTAAVIQALRSERTGKADTAAAPRRGPLN